MKKTVFCLISSLFLISSNAFSQRTQPDPNPVSVDVSVENTLFSPVAKAKEGVVFKPKVENAKKTKVWFVTIRNSETNKKVREIVESKKAVPGKIVWDGLASDMNIAADGQYSYKFFVLTDKGSYALEKDNVITIDSTPPFVSLKCDQDVCFVNEEDGSFVRNLVVYLSAGDENGIDFQNSYLEVLSYSGKRVKVFHFDDRIPEFIIWDGIDEVYNMPLPIGNYKVNLVIADKAGNISHIDSEIFIAPMPKDPEPPKEIEVKQEDRGLVINLSSKVLFDVAKSDLRPEAEKSLMEVSEILQVYSKNKVLIEGHTDSSGKKEKNLQLSIDRAQAVFEFLAGSGVDEERMQVFGFGADKPVASNDTEKGKEQNRRVEIVILKTDIQEAVAETDKEDESGSDMNLSEAQEQDAEYVPQENGDDDQGKNTDNQYLDNYTEKEIVEEIQVQ